MGPSKDNLRSSLKPSMSSSSPDLRATSCKDDPSYLSTTAGSVNRPSSTHSQLSTNVSDAFCESPPQSKSSPGSAAAGCQATTAVSSVGRRPGSAGIGTLGFTGDTLMQPHRLSQSVTELPGTRENRVDFLPPVIGAY